jgi:hypothetical protein
MHDLTTKKELHIKIDTEELNPTQIRLLKSVTSLLGHVLTADEESEYFNASADLLKKVAEVIKHSDFANQNKKIHNKNIKRQQVSEKYIKQWLAIYI